eukprot:scaffold30356_cov68-Phaeocystis_antarctica.AAC.2
MGARRGAVHPAGGLPPIRRRAHRRGHAPAAHPHRRPRLGGLQRLGAGVRRLGMPCACHARAMRVPCSCHARGMPTLCPCRAHAVPTPCTCAPAQAKQLVEALMRKDASERLTIEQMLQHPWLLHEGRTSGAEGGGGGTLQQRGRSMMLSMIGTRTQRDAGGASTEGLSEQVLAFRRLTAQLRATCFAVMLRQQAAEREAKARG